MERFGVHGVPCSPWRSLARACVDRLTAFEPARTGRLRFHSRPASSLEIAALRRPRSPRDARGRFRSATFAGSGANLVHLSAADAVSGPARDPLSTLVLVHLSMPEPERVAFAAALAPARSPPTREATARSRSLRFRACDGDCTCPVRWRLRSPFGSRRRFTSNEPRAVFKAPLSRRRRSGALSATAPAIAKRRAAFQLAPWCSLTLADARARLRSPRRHAPACDHLAVIAAAGSAPTLRVTSISGTAHLAGVRHEASCSPLATIGILASLPRTFRRSDRSRAPRRLGAGNLRVFREIACGARGRSKQLAPSRRPRGLRLARGRAPLGARPRSRPRRPRRSPPRLSAARCSAFAAIRARSTPLHLAGGSRSVTSVSPRGVPTLRARGMVHLAVERMSRGSRLCSPPRVPRRDHLAMIPFVPAVRAAHVRLRLSTPALVRLAGCPPPFASSRRSRCARLPGARGSQSSSLDESRSASTFDGHRRALIRTRPKPNPSFDVPPSSAPMVAVSASCSRTTPLRIRALCEDLELTSRRSRAHRSDADRGSTPVLRVQNRAHLSMLPLSSASLRAPPRVREVAFAPPRPRSALIRSLSRSCPSRDVHARARRMFVVRRSRVGRRSSSPCPRPPPAPHGAFSGARSPRAAPRSVRLTAIESRSSSRGSRMEAAFATAIRPHTDHLSTTN